MSTLLLIFAIAFLLTASLLAFKVIRNHARLGKGWAVLRPEMITAEAVEVGAARAAGHVVEIPRIAARPRDTHSRAAA